MLWNKFNIKIQLIIFMTLVVTVVETATLFVILNLQKNDSMNNAVIEVETMTKSLNNDLLKVMLNPNTDTFSDITFRLSAFTKIQGVILIDENKNEIFQYGNIDSLKELKNDILKQESIFDKDNLYIKKDISADDYTFGYSLVCADLSQYQYKQQLVTTIIFAILPFALLLGLIVSLFLSKSYTKPFAKLVEAMRESDPTKNKIVKLETKAENEIKELFDGFNTLMSQVYKSTQDIYLKAEHDKLKEIHKHTKESIEYASLIQEAIIPENHLFKEYFNDYFVYWQPKDLVGGDIYFLNELRNKDECLLMYIDCTGHGVPGAFVTMLVKAVEEQILAEIINNHNMDISPSMIMGHFNRSIKQLLKQETDSSISNAGFDGGIIYYDKKKSIIKFCGAQTPLFYTDTDGNLNMIKGDKYSVGYKKCSSDYVYGMSEIKVSKGMKFYCTTDGYLDQNGGEKDFPFGKKRFKSIIQDNHQKSMEDQKVQFLQKLKEYESMIENNVRNDDITLIGFEI